LIAVDRNVIHGLGRRWSMTMTTIRLLALASVSLCLATAPAHASLLGASLDVTFNGGSLTDDFGSVTLTATPTPFDTPYGYITVSAGQLTLGPPSYASSFSYGAGTGFTGFIFTYGSGATVTDDSFDASSTFTPSGLLNLYPRIGVNFLGETIHTGQAVVLDVTGSFSGPPVVPEPTTFALLLSGAAMVLGLHRRRSAAR